MAEAMIVAISKAALWVAEAVYTAAIAVVPEGVAAFAANATYVTAFTAGVVGVSYGTAALTAPDMPSVQASKVAKKQTMPPRTYCLAPGRYSGSYMCWEANKYLVDVYAIADQQMHSIGSRWLHDDLVTLDVDGDVEKLSSGAYGGKRIHVATRLGLPTETSYTTEFSTYFADLGSGIWTADHRGDGITSACVICDPQDQEYFHATYPQGYPVYSQECFPAIYDPREVDHDIEDISTWDVSYNPMVLLAHYLTGYADATQDPKKLDLWNMRIEPQLASWEVAFDDCDEPIALKEGGTEARYRAAQLSHTAATDPAEVVNKLLEACDGWLFECGDGSYLPQAGKYRPPTVTLGDDPGDVIAVSLQDGRPAEKAANHWPFTYISAEHGYAAVPGDPWENADRIAELGEILSQGVAFACVPSHGQGRRLLKRADARANPNCYGQIVFSLAGLALFGERYFNFVLSDGAWQVNRVMEIQGSPRVNWETLSVAVDVIGIDTDKLEEWNPATEEGEAPEVLEDVEGSDLTTPEILALEQHATQPKVVITIVTYADANHFAYRYRATGTTSWTTGAVQGATAGGGGEQITSTIVSTGVEYEFQVAAAESSGLNLLLSDWSESVTITLTE